VRLKRAIAVSQQDADRGGIACWSGKRLGWRCAGAVGNRKIQIAVAVEIPGHHRNGLGTCSVGNLRSKRAIRLSQQNRDIIVIAIGHREIDDPVAIEIAASDRRGNRAHRKVGPAENIGLGMRCNGY
jgi:hypothetical protein